MAKCKRCGASGAVPFNEFDPTLYCENCVEIVAQEKIGPDPASYRDTLEGFDACEKDYERQRSE